MVQVLRADAEHEEPGWERAYGTGLVDAILAKVPCLAALREERAALAVLRLLRVLADGRAALPTPATRAVLTGLKAGETLNTLRTTYNTLKLS